MIKIHTYLLEPILSRSPFIIRYGVYSIIFLAPLILEGITPLTSLIIEFLAVIIILFWITSRISAKHPAPLDITSIIVTICFFIILIAFQLVPLPLDDLAKIHKLQDLLMANEYPLLQAFYKETYRSISLANDLSLYQLFRISIIFGIFLVSRDIFRTKKHRMDLLHLLSLAGVFQVIIGLFHLFTQAPSIYFLGEKSTFPFFGTFIGTNRNAAYLNMIVPILIGLALEDRYSDKLISNNNNNNRLLSFKFLFEENKHGLLPPFIYLMATVFILLGVVLCHSRMGLIVSFYCIFSVLCLLYARKNSYKKGLAIWLSTLSAVSIATIFSWERVITWLSAFTGKNMEIGRPTLWNWTMDMALDHFWTGTGFGTFPYSFGPYNNLVIPYQVTAAENTWLEIFAELGVIGLFTLCGIMLFFLKVLHKNKFWEYHHRKLGLVPVFIAITGICIHASVDLSFHGYGTTITLAILAGLLLAGSKAKMDGDFNTAFRHGVTPFRIWVPIIISLPVFVILSIHSIENIVIDRIEPGKYTAKTLFEKNILKIFSEYVPWSWKPALYRGIHDMAKAKELLIKATNESENNAHEILKTASLYNANALFWLQTSAHRMPLATSTHRMLSHFEDIRVNRETSTLWARLSTTVQPHDYRNWLQLGDVLFRAKKHEESLSALYQALSRAPENAVPKLCDNIFKSAQKDVGKAAQSIPKTGHWSIPFAFGNTLSKYGYYYESGEWFKQFLQQKIPTHLPIRDLVWIALNHNDFELAKIAVIKLQEDFPHVKDGFRLESEILYRAGDKEKALASLYKYIEKFPLDEEPIIRTSIILSELARYEEGLQNLEKLISQERKTVLLLTTKAEILLKMKQRSLAADSLKEAIQLNASEEKPYFMLYQILSEIGLKKEAGEILESCIAKVQSSKLCKSYIGKDIIINNNVQ